jgi:hypothetical protein
LQVDPGWIGVTLEKAWFTYLGGFRVFGLFGR